MWKKRPEEFTSRALIFGLFLGSLTALQNCFFAFRYGWTTMGNTTSAILGCGMLKVSDKVRHKFSVRHLPLANAKENTVLQTTSVAAASMVGGASLPFAVFAMSNQLRKYNSYPGDSLVGESSTFDPTFAQLVLFCFSLCFFGFFLALPLRARLIKRLMLPFPYATASAEAIKSLHSTNIDKNCDSTVVLMLKSLGSAILFKLAIWTMKDLEDFPIFGTLLKNRYYWKANLSPANFGQGFIVEPKYILSQVFGSFVASGVLLPIAYSKKGNWYAEDATGFEGLDAFYILPAISIIVLDSAWKVGHLALSSAQRLRRYHSNRNNVIEEKQKNIQKKSDISTFTSIFGVNGDVMSPSVWLCGVLITGLLPVFIFPILFPKTKTYQVLIAVIAGPIWSIGIGESVGVTGSNLASACGKLMIIFFSAWEGATSDTTGFDHIVPALALGALSIAIVDAAMDLVRDFKTAEIIGADPRAMVAAQLLGAAVSCVVSSAAYLMLSSSAPSDSLPAVISRSYRAIAVIFSGGFSALPDNVGEISVICAMFALMNNILSDYMLSEKNKKYMPHSTAVGIGIYLLPGQSLTVLFGLCVRIGLLRYGWKMPKQREVGDIQLSASQQSLSTHLLDDDDVEKKKEENEMIDSVIIHVKESNTDELKARLKIVAAGFLAGDGLAGICTGILFSNRSPPFSAPWN